MNTYENLKLLFQETITKQLPFKYQFTQLDELTSYLKDTAMRRNFVPMFELEKENLLNLSQQEELAKMSYEVKKKSITYNIIREEKLLDIIKRTKELQDETLETLLECETEEDKQEVIKVLNGIAEIHSVVNSEIEVIYKHFKYELRKDKIKTLLLK